MSVHGQLGMDDGFNRNAAQLNQGYHSSKNLYASDSGVISTDVLSHANSSQHSDHAPHAVSPSSPTNLEPSNPSLAIRSLFASTLALCHRYSSPASVAKRLSGRRVDR